MRTTTLGSLLDPVADKVLVLATLIVLVDLRIFDGWMVASSLQGTWTADLNPPSELKQIKEDLKLRLAELADAGKLLEAQRLEQRTRFDMEMIETTGSCAGIENYSRYLTGRRPGEPPPTLFEYIPGDALLIVDESHVTVPQIGAMFRGDYQRKSVLAEHGFRLPSCIDNRPLRFEEWEGMRPETILPKCRPVARPKVMRLPSMSVTIRPIAILPRVACFGPAVMYAS